ncbi:hypothetical protein [Xanthomonas phage RTH11]|nr:hypothetical protein [Xanthomonas phage RTH11]
MDSHLFRLIDEKHIPHFNPRIVNGLATEEMKRTEAYITQVLRTATAELAPELVFKEMVRCTPREEYNEIVRRVGMRNTIEHARSDMYMVKIIFELNGEALPPRYLYLPTCRRGGLMTIRGSMFAVSPVMADKAISVGHNFIFIPMAWDRMNFYRTPQYFYANEKQEAVDVAWSKIHHYKLKARRTNSKMDVRANTVLPHYLFAKYGLTRVFDEMANTQIVVGSSREITTEAYPPGDWIICRSTMFKPRTVKDKNYVGPDIRLAIPAADWNASVASLVAGFFYVADFFPDRVTPDEVDEPRLWRILLGYMVFGPGHSEGKLAEDINVHMGSLDNYIETQTRKRLEDVGVYVEDIYQLFMHLIEKFDFYITQSTTNLSSSYGKRLMVLPYALSDLTWAIHRFMFTATSQRKRKPLTKDDVLKILNKTLKTNTAFKMNKQHGEVNPVAVPGDNLYFKVTSHVVLQESSSGGRAKTRSSTDDPSKVLHISVAVAGSFNTMGKAEPTGRAKLNPCTPLSTYDNEIQENPALINITRATQAMIQRDS